MPDTIEFEFKNAVPFSGTMYSVHSSKFSAIGHQFSAELKAGVLQVEFKNKSLYQYAPVSKELFSQVFTETEKGKWLNENIINNKDIKYVKVGESKLL